MELDETNRGVVALYAELDTQAAAAAARHRPEEPLPGLHEPRVPHADLVDPQPGAAAARPHRRPADARAGKAGRASSRRRPTSSPRWSTTCSTSPRWRPAASTSRRPGSRWSTCSRRCAACSGRCVTNPEVTLVFEEPQQSSRLYTDDKKLSQILRNFISNALKFTAKGEVRVSAQRRTPTRRSPSRSPTPASASRPKFHGAIFQRLHADRLADPEAPARHRPRACR